MGQIQNSLNQLFASGIGASLAASHSPYMKGREATKELRKTQAVRKERLSQLGQTINKPEVSPNVSDRLPMGGKETQYEKITPENERKLEQKIAKYETEGDKEVDARIEKETKQGAQTYSPYFEEMREITEAYNLGAAKLGEERLDLGEITKKEQDLAQQIKESLQRAYTTKEGILQTAQMRREYLQALRDKKKEVE